MARIQTFQGGNIQRQGVTDARFRPADWGPSPFEGLEQLGKAGSQAVDKLDEIEDVKARVEANRLAVEHSEATRALGQKVKETLGEGAEDAANNGVEELKKATADVLGRASPRARMLLENEVRVRNGATTDSWLEHGFRQKADALETTSVARINRVVEEAADIEDEAAATEMLVQIKGINEERARFFGKGSDWLREEDRKHVSSFFKSRAVKLAAGSAGSASAAIGYADKNRDKMTDADYLDVVGAYNNSAMDEAAVSIVYGASPVGAAVDKPADPNDGGPPARLDPMSFFKAFTIPHEGRAYVIDSNGAGVKYGINAQYNPGVDVKNLTEDQAARIFETKYYKKSGADKLPPALAAVHVDTFYLNEREAGRILRESGGDVDKYVELRRAFLNGLVRKNPAKFGKYQRGWENRTKELADYADRLGGDGTPLPVDANTDLEGMRTAVMARTDIGLNLKRRIISTMESRRAEVRQERQIAEESVDRQLHEAALNLGENFTDVKQLPQDLFISAPPNIRDSYIKMAKTNRDAKENKPMSPEVAAQVGFLRTFRPQSLADKDVQKMLAKKGVPAGTLRQLAMEGGQAQGALAAAKPEAVARGALESIARPAFEKSGIFLWTTEAGGDRPKDKAAKMAERQQDAARQLQALDFLSEAARVWAVNNPGKRPDEKTMKGWVAIALVRNQATGQAIGTLNDREIVAQMGDNNRRTVEQRLRQAGLPPTPANVASYYRRYIVQNPGALR
jgi:Glycosyl hydrolase 108